MLLQWGRDALPGEILQRGGHAGGGRYPYGLNGRQAIQVIVLFGGRHARDRVRLEGNLAHQGGVGKITVRRRIRRGG